MVNLISEIVFKTARSSGKGGQNVNKVETQVQAFFHVENSKILTDRQKKRILKNLGNKINKEGYLVVKSQKERSQAGNKEDAIVKIHVIIANALIVRKKRKATEPTKASKEKRLKSKKRQSLLKKNRKKIDDGDNE